MTRYAVALGSNLGDRLGHLRAGLDALSRLGTVTAVSGLYETEPVGGPEQDPYLNAVAVIVTDLGPDRLLERTAEIEAARGRERGERWGPRTLDLDLVAMEPGEVRRPELTIPHPRAAERGFVAIPLAEVWPEAVVGEGITAAAAVARLLNQGVDLLERRWWPVSPQRGRNWVGAQAVLLVAVTVVLLVDASPFGSRAPWLLLLAAVLLGLGLYLVVASSLRLGPGLTSLPEPREGAVLVETGPYARARHPIYGGVVLVSLGLSALVGSLFAALLSLALVPFFWAKSSYEERRLRITYPGYRAYQRRVGRRFLPMVL